MHSPMPDQVRAETVTQQEILDSLPAHLRPFVREQDYARYTTRDQAVWRFIMKHLTRQLADTAHPVYLEGLIINLIDNSLKYAGPRVEIQISLECTPEGKYLKVADNGPGIPETYKRQIFNKFFRIPAGNQHNVKGYGLGLNFAAQVMTQVGGSISFKNLPEGGCMFILEFPNN